VISVTVVTFVAHPTVSVVGRTCGVGPGPQERTAGTEATVVEVGTEDVVVDTGGLVVEAPVAEEWVGGEVPDPTLNPMAIPTPRAARTSAMTPARTTVLRRTVISFGSLFATTIYGTLRGSENDEWGLADPEALHDAVGGVNRGGWTTTEDFLRRHSDSLLTAHFAPPLDGEVGAFWAAAGRGATPFLSGGGWPGGAAWVSLTRVPGTIEKSWACSGPGRPMSEHKGAVPRCQSVKDAGSWPLSSRTMLPSHLHGASAP
jgi:hypothetical protein